MFIGLNPSTADEKNDDPTIRRCIGFAQNWGFDALCMTNLFAFRATNPGDMLSQADPIGEDNNKTLCDLAKDASLIVAAWGTNGSYLGRDAYVKGMIPGLHCLQLTKEGHPGHPLYLPRTVKPIPFGWSHQ